MTAHDRHILRTAQPIGKPARRLDDLGTERFARRLVVFMPHGAEIDALVDAVKKDLPGVADSGAVKRVVSHNPDCLWAIGRQDQFDASAPSGSGLIAFLMLNRAGMHQLLDGTFDGTNPDLSLLVRQSEKPAGIYLWAMHARGVAAGGIPLVMEKLNTPLYSDVDI